MKKGLLFCICLVLVYAAVAQSSVTKNVLVAFRKNQVSPPNWIFMDTVSYSYDGRGNIAEMIYYRDVDGLVPHDKFAFQYNATNKCTLVTMSRYDTITGLWNKKSHDYCLYNANNDTIEHGFENWNGTSWVAYSKDVYGYDSYNKLKSATSMVSHYVNGPLINSSRILYSYDSQGRLAKQELASWDDANQTFVNSNISLFDYNAQGQLATLTHNVWDTTMNDYTIIDIKTTYTYNLAGQVTVSNTKLWEPFTNVYKNYQKTENVFDGNGNNTSTTNYTSPNFPTPYGGGERIQTTYNNDNNPVYNLIQEYDGTSFYDNYQEFLYYETRTFADTAAGITEVNTLDARLLTNPVVSNTVSLKLDIENTTNVSIGIYNMEGKVITYKDLVVVVGDVVINVDAPTETGTYLLLISDTKSHRQSTIKFVKQ